MPKLKQPHDPLPLSLKRLHIFRNDLAPLRHHIPLAALHVTRPVILGHRRIKRGMRLLQMREALSQDEPLNPGLLQRPSATANLDWFALALGIGTRVLVVAVTDSGMIMRTTEPAGNQRPQHRGPMLRIGPQGP